MQRRDFINVIASAGAAAAWPFDTRAQQSKEMRRVGALMAAAESDNVRRGYMLAFQDGLRKLGWTEGHNIQIDPRWAVDAESMQRLAKDLVARKPDLILSHSTPTTAALLQETRTIPIVFALVSDPVGSRFVTSFPRPGSNATGFTNIEPTMSGKWLELLKEVAPRVTRVALLFNPTTAPYTEQFFLTPFKAAAGSFAMQAISTPVHSAPELESVVAAWAREPNGGLVAMTDIFLIAHRSEMTSLAARYRLPAVYPYQIFTEIGGLLSYGNDTEDNFRRAATYADRILKGAKPSELPVQAPVKFELVINLKTAKALGLNVPLQLQQRADRVIE